MLKYFDSRLSWEGFSALQLGLTQKAAGFSPKAVRAKVLSEEAFSDERVISYMRRPFDIGYAHISDVSPLWNRSRPELRQHLEHSRSSFITRPLGVANPEGVPFWATRILGEQDAIRGHAYFFPTQITNKPTKKSAQQLDLLSSHSITANLSPTARAYLATLRVPNPDNDHDTAALIWMHALAIGYSPAYLRENADGIRQDWPRIPLPNSKELLLASAALGKQIAALLDTESPVAGVTSGAIRQELKQIAVVEGKTPLNLSITAGWGSADKGGVTMPGKGKRIKREPTASEAVKGLGDMTHDVYLNEETHWRNIPTRVWEYTIGGYQVIKKWLSYREEKLLGRPITQDEAREVRDMARRIAAIILLEPELDENYERVKAATWEWPQAPAKA